MGQQMLLEQVLAIFSVATDCWIPKAKPSLRGPTEWSGLKRTSHCWQAAVSTMARHPSLRNFTHEDDSFHTFEHSHVDRRAVTFWTCAWFGSSLVLRSF